MIYVDALRDYGWKLGPNCHLFADTLEELHAFAQGIGMKRAWFQLGGKRELPHYDLTEKRRKVAVAKGAKEITRKEFCDMIEKLVNTKG